MPLAESSQPLVDPKLIGAKLRDGKMMVVGGRAQCRELGGERLLGLLMMLMSCVEKCEGWC